jgi:histidine ammonia-lyase
VIENAQMVVAVELLCALRGLQLTQEKLDPEHRRLGEGTAKVYELLGRELPPPDGDRYVRTDLEKVIRIVQDGSLVRLLDGLSVLNTPIRLPD